jgi:hypothetical protein
VSDFQDYLQGLQLLGGVLALPRTAQYAQQSALAHRKMLEGTGLDPADINAMYPDAPLQWLSPGDKPGIGGKILGGVGDVGALLSTIAGQPIGPPRASVTEIASAAKLRSQHGKDIAEANLQQVLADPKSTPEQIRAAMAATGNIDATGRVISAQLRSGAPEKLPYGTSALGQRAYLEQLKRTNPNDPRIPDIQRAIDAEDARHPLPPPPRPPRDPAADYTARHEAMMAARDKDAQKLGYKPGTDEYNTFMGTGRPPLQGRAAKDLDYNFFFKQALEQEQKRAAAEFDDVNMDTVRSVAQKGWQAYQDSVKPKGGTTPPAAETPPAAKPTPQIPPPPATKKELPAAQDTAVTATPSSTYAQGPPSSAAATQGVPPPPAETTSPPKWTSPPEHPPIPEASALDPADRAALLKYTLAGLSPAEIASNYPDLWRRTGFVGSEDMPRDVLYYRLIAAEQAPPTQDTQQSIPPGPEGSPLNTEFDYNALTRDGQKQADQIKADMQAGKIAPGVAAARLQVLPRR